MCVRFFFSISPLLSSSLQALVERLSYRYMMFSSKEGWNWDWKINLKWNYFMLTYTRKWRAAGVERRDRNLEIWIIIFHIFTQKTDLFFPLRTPAIMMRHRLLLLPLEFVWTRWIAGAAEGSSLKPNTRTQHSHRKSKAIFFFRSRNLLIIFLTLCFFASPLFSPITRLHRAKSGGISRNE